MATQHLIDTHTLDHVHAQALLVVRTSARDVPWRWHCHHHVDLVAPGSPLFLNFKEHRRSYASDEEQ